MTDTTDRLSADERPTEPHQVLDLRGTPWDLPPGETAGLGIALGPASLAGGVPLQGEDATIASRNSDAPAGAIRYHGGMLTERCQVQMIFWGESWDGPDENCAHD